MIQSRPNIDALTGLRFVAAVMVLLSHFPIPHVEGVGARFMASGYAGVTLFFVLSGFILTLNYAEKLQGLNFTSSLADYFVARFARIYPVYGLTILAIWMYWKPDVDLWLYLSALQVWSSDAAVAFGLNQPAWSVGIEVFFYLVFPWLILMMRRCGLFSRPMLLAFAFGTITVSMLLVAMYFTATGRSALSPSDAESAHRWLYRNPVLRLGDFMLGMLGAIYFLSFASTKKVVVQRWRWLTSAAVLAILMLMLSRWNFHSAYSWDVAYAIPFLLLIVGLAVSRTTWIGRFLSSPLLVVLGEASYTFYLVHWFMGVTWPFANRSVFPGMGSYAFFFVAVTLVSIGIYFAVERPSRKFIRRAASSAPDKNEARLKHSSALDH